MDTAARNNADQPETVQKDEAKLRARDWFWRPRHARLWWFGAGLYWLGMVASHYVRSLSEFYSTALAGYLNVAFYPPVILMILGVGFVRAKLDKGDWVLTAPDPSMRQPERSVGGFLDPMADPLDPRSPRYWDR